MNRMKGVPSFIVIVAVVWGILRALHLLIPAAQPDVLEGPFELGSLTEVEPITGFPPRIPAYHPVALGDEPVLIVAERKPASRVTIVWRRQKLLELIERPAGGVSDLPVDAEAVEGHEGWWSWKRGGVTHLWGSSGPLEVRVRTNLSREDAIRIASTLVPLHGVR